MTPANQLVFGSNPVDLFGWGDTGEDSLFAQDTLVSGQSAQQWTLRMTTQEAALLEVANRRLRGLLVPNKSFNRTDVEIGDLFFPLKSCEPEGRASLTWPGKELRYRKNRCGDGISESNLQGGQVLRAEESGSAGCGRSA